jgi:hypothetical protein
MTLPPPTPPASIYDPLARAFAQGHPNCRYRWAAPIHIFAARSVYDDQFRRRD